MSSLKGFVALVVPLCDFGASACASGATATSPTRNILVTEEWILFGSRATCRSRSSMAAS